MASKKTAAGMDLIVAALKRNKNVTYGQVKAAADAKRVTVYPIMFGRAKALLGLVKVAKRGQGKAARRKAGKRGPGRPRKVGRRASASSNSLDGLTQLVDTLRRQERENRDLRSVIEKIGAVIEKAM